MTSITGSEEEDNILAGEGLDDLDEELNIDELSVEDRHLAVEQQE